MQFPDVLCYIFLTITVAASCVESEDKHSTELTESEHGSRSKRETVIVPYPDILYPKTNVIYKRIQPAHRNSPSPRRRYGSPRPHYKTNRPKPHRKPAKKYKGYHKQNFLSTKHLPSTPKYNRSSKPRYGSRPKPRPAAFHNPPTNMQGFGEPPVDYSKDYLPSKLSYGEPPIDSYGAPINTKVEDHKYNRQTYPVWSNDQEASFGFSNKPPTFVKPESDDTFVERIPQEYNEDGYVKQQKNKNSSKKKKPQYFEEIFSASRSKPKKVRQEPKLKEEIVVGGQYAEPPPRYVPNFEPSAPMVDTDDEFSPLYGYVNSKGVSPYVNYKNSNLAFSPQNLNDAFSVVDK